MIYDCFLYYDEEMLLDLRLHTLSDVVDKFVIVESTHTFTGKPKRLNFDLEKFRQFEDKIIYVVFDHPPHQDAWQNEADTRNAIMNGLVSAEQDDIILVSDVDEIFDPVIIATIQKNKLCTIIHQNFYNYQFNLQVFNTDGSPRKCTLPKAITYRNLVGFFGGKPEELRNTKRSSIKRNWLKWQWLKWNTAIIAEGGWHFSWIMTPQRIAEKMSSISHTEYDLPEFNNPEHITKVIEQAEDIWGRERKLQVQILDIYSFPRYLVEHQALFKPFIRA
ncbi:benzoate transporter [Erwinia pyri]|uniref:Benzoate transporter n=1 Tax=Erwinia pyri TaxID=3062598 RepID=A0AA50DN01_9GAMM|nr:benzoate transporter [Erwinia sp. DE2]WLS80906.1 benzoate transporter [Erwinia sp. DE2]